MTDVGQTDRELWACRAERERERAVEREGSLARLGRLGATTTTRLAEQR